jgi:hypothetical protein
MLVPYRKYSSCAVSQNRKRGTRRPPGSQIHADDNEEALGERQKIGDLESKRLIPVTIDHGWLRAAGHAARFRGR